MAARVDPQDLADLQASRRSAGGGAHPAVVPFGYAGWWAWRSPADDIARAAPDSYLSDGPGAARYAVPGCDDASVLRDTVLLVEDDHALRDVVARALREDGLTVVTASDGRSALASATAELAAIVLDIGLPDADGRDVCLALRARGTTAPVLFLTARSAVVDLLSGFAAGGDDYLTKPFHVAELLARVRALLRRAAPDRAAVDGGLVLDPAAHAIRCGQLEIALSPTEFRLLAVLLGRPDVVVRRRELLRAGWPDGAIVSENTLDQYLARVRRKLGAVGTTTRVETVRGVGYRAVGDPA